MVGGTLRLPTSVRATEIALEGGTLRLAGLLQGVWDVDLSGRRLGALSGHFLGKCLR